ncbi:MAG: hypothetical protein ACKOWN_01160 [Microbacteriaceae bacterium]
MSFDDDDDDAVVPSGSRRSSFVPPSEHGDFVPSLPPIDEPEAPTSSTGQVPTIAAVGEDPIAQTPSFADSAEVPLVEEEKTLPTGSIVIEIPVDETPVMPEPAETRDQFGLPFVSDPIDIPQVVVTDPLPDALPGTGSVFDDNRLFPPAVVTPNVDEVIEDPILEEFGTPADRHESAAIPEEPWVPADESPVEAVEDPLAASVLSSVELPARRSMTPGQLADVLGANEGMSSNDQMALLDSQIPLREADIDAVHEFVRQIDDENATDRDSRIGEAAERFGDIAPDLFTNRTPVAPTSEFSDDSTPITGNPVVEHIEIVDVVTDADGDVVEIDVVEIDEVVVETAPSIPAATVVPEDDQEWSLAAPTDVVDATPTNVERRHWWAVTALVGAIVAAIVVAAGSGVSNLGAAPSIAFVLAGLALTVPVIEMARRTGSRSGASLRGVLEETFGRIPGRVTSVLVGVFVSVGLVLATYPALSALGTQLESSSFGVFLTTVVPSGASGLALTGISLFGGAVIAALPHRLFRAKTLVLAGWTALGAGTVVAMGAALLLSSTTLTTSHLSVDIAAAGLASTVAIVLVLASMFGFQEASRIREKQTGILWVSIGFGLGVLTLAGTVTSALLSPEGSHFFFAQNPVLHIIAPSPILNVVLGAAAFVPVIVLVGALGFRAIGSLTTRDDREDPSVILRWVLVLVPAALVAVAVWGYSELTNLPSLDVVAVPIAAIAGVLAARGCVTRELTTRAARRGLLAVAIVATALGLGFAHSTGAAFEWVGYINQILRPLGYGLLYIGSVAPLATAVLTFLASLAIVIPSTRRAARVS